MSAKDLTADDIVAFWRAAGPERWFKRDDAFDADIRSHFLGVHEAAAAGKLADWEKSVEGTLALFLLLDQFPRNMFRNDARAFATDPLALSLAKRAISRGFDTKVAPEFRAFFYMPFMHAENMVEQDRSLSLFKRMGNANNLKFAEIHADVIRRFGRFPHRNKALGRATAPDEQAFLDGGGFSA